MSQKIRWSTDVVRWFDSEAGSETNNATDGRRIRLVRIIPFAALHLACLGAFFTGVSPFALAFAAAFFFIRMFSITAFYHRYFSHKTFKAGRAWTFMFAALGASAAQRGPLWWAAHHRHHHQASDTEDDLHSPHHGGFWWSHAGWFACDDGFGMDKRRVRDWMKYPELVFLNRFDILVPMLAGLMIFGLGELLAAFAPGLGTDGPQLFVWGFVISTVALFHATVSINSLSHVWGSRRFDTPDSSRNNLILAILTLGEGWHNNHHRWPQSARQGFRWYEIDITYYVLWMMEKFGIISDLKPVPEHIQKETNELDLRRRQP